MELIINSVVVASEVAALVLMVVLAVKDYKSIK
jgi:hypothetical protein